MSDKSLAFAVSVISAPPLVFLESLPMLEDLGVERIHVDIMDGRFVPRLGLYPEFVREIRRISSLPIDVHMMVNRPLELIEDFVSVGASRLIFHVESTKHVHRAVDRAREAGAEVGLALNPHTSSDSLMYVVEHLSSVTLMAINPGIIGHRFIESTWEKLRDMREFLGRFENNCEIEVDGGVTFENLAGLREGGADRVVIGAGTVFRPGRSVRENLKVLNTMRERG